MLAGSEVVGSHRDADRRTGDRHGDRAASDEHAVKQDLNESARARCADVERDLIVARGRDEWHPTERAVVGQAGIVGAVGDELAAVGEGRRCAGGNRIAERDGGRGRRIDGGDGLEKRRGEIEDLIGQTPDISRGPARGRIENIEIAAGLLHDLVCRRLRGGRARIELRQCRRRAVGVFIAVVAVVDTPAAFVSDALHAVGAGEGGVGPGHRGVARIREA